MEDPKVLSSLPRYVDIVKNRRIAKFRISRLVPVEFSETEPIEDLWKLHSKALATESELERSLDAGIAHYSELKPPTTSLLHLKSVIARRILESCILCERRCIKDRTRGELGYCRVGKDMLVSSYFDHMGEEPEIVPSFTVCDQKSAELAWDAISGAFTARTGV
ncbi:MAG: hypothetical protein ACUVQ5_01880 [Candidatus Methanomethylicaceae archaeon]